MRKKFLLRLMMSLLFMCSLFAAQAQNEPVAMAETMRSNGKIYVVVAVCLAILLGLFLYVFSLDRKISKLERRAAGDHLTHA